MEAAGLLFSDWLQEDVQARLHKEGHVGSRGCLHNQRRRRSGTRPATQNAATNVVGMRGFNVPFVGIPGSIPIFVMETD